MEKKTDSKQTDRPSPIPAWKHYDISKVAEEKVMAELEAHHPESLLVGLGIGYLFVPQDKDSPETETYDRFCMAHGYWVDCDDVQAEKELMSDDEKKEQPSDLDDEFIEQLYKDVRRLILKSAPEEPAGRYMVSVEVTTAHFSKPKLECKGERCDWCTEHGKWHIFKKKKNSDGTACIWVCKNKKCGS
jgi:hypothetical protein